MLNHCQAGSWPSAVTDQGSCVSTLVRFTAFDEMVSTVSWALCPSHYAALTTCEACGRLSAVGPYNTQGRCLHCTSAAHHGADRMWWVTWTPPRRRRTHFFWNTNIGTSHTEVRQ